MIRWVAVFPGPGVCVLKTSVGQNNRELAARLTVGDGEGGIGRNRVGEFAIASFVALGAGPVVIWLVQTAQFLLQKP